jgi:hypothetical protein
MAKKSSKRAEVSDEATPQAAQTSARRGDGKRQGKAVDGASPAPGASNDAGQKAAGKSNPGWKNLRPPWKKGDVPNPKGRPKGSRHKLSAAFIQALHDSFEEHGDAAIMAVIQDSPAEYLRIIASIVPKQFGIEEGSEDCFLKLWRAISDGTINELRRAP